MLSGKIRRQFLHYFKQKGHVILPSSSTIPESDPTLLFTNAGMNQFKEIFLGKTTSEYRRVASSQKCIRVGGKHNDLDNVGHTKRHLTFFEMLGNFSFGDYFKREAISFAWEVATSIFKFPEEKIFISVYEKDEEAFALWKAIVDEKKISRIGKRDNFWAMGETGPCGPCSELFFDRGPDFGSAKAVHEDVEGERFLEFWNLVFMQYNRDANGHLSPLPKQCVDTGVGFERILALMMNVPSLFQTDIFTALIDRIEEIADRKYNPANETLAPAFHVIADHIRSLSFAIADGAIPSNIERGYVLRKILRRAVRYGRMLGLNRPFLSSILPRLIEVMGEDFPEIKSAKMHIGEILTLEEESFLQTLRKGGNILSAITEHAQKSSQREISGEEAFKLKDTYGFPLEEILLIAKDSGLSVNLDQYQILEEQAKERSRASKQTYQQSVETNLFEDFVSHHGVSTFVGYTETEIEATVKGLIVDGKLVDLIEEGQEGLIILDQTPFYAEQGGQVGDTGTLLHQQSEFAVKDCQSPFPGVITHVGLLKSGNLMVGEPLIAKIESERRSAIAKNHTASHLLHYALHQILGPHIRQSGSLVKSDKLRFDFNHHKALTKNEIREIEILVNEKIRENLLPKTYELSFEEVQKHPEIKQFFSEKYGALVRVVDIGNYSKELCGGTHAKQLGSIGIFRIKKESGIAKGVRRIEAVTGDDADSLHYQTEDELMDLSSLLKAKSSNLTEAVKALILENKQLKEQALSAQRKALHDLASSLLSRTEEVNQVPLLTAIVNTQKKELVHLAKELLSRMQTGIILLCQVEGDKCQLLLKISPDLAANGIDASALIKEIAPHIEGSGGGSRESAQAGGNNPKGAMLAFAAMKEILKVRSSS